MGKNSSSISCVVKLLAAFAICAVSQTGAFEDEPLLYDKFPEGFMWALATSAYQIEGGWNEDGKGESNWDWFVHGGGSVAGGATGDVACDSYHKWEDDIAMLSNIGVTHYRFSIAWTRILPNGVGEVNQLGIDYYNKLIDGLLAAGIQPMVTLYHWDLPQVLEERGGWLSTDIPDWFEEYAAACFEAFGDRVKLWITFNEPWVTCIMGYGNGEHPPGLTGLGTNVYQCAHNIIKSHARAYRIYESDFAAAQEGEIGITLNVQGSLAASTTQEDLDAFERDKQFNLGWFAHPILVNGNYPQVMIDQIGQKSEDQGFPESRLPVFSVEEMAMISGTADFLGINHYSAFIIEHGISNINDVSYFADQDTRTYQDPSWYSPSEGTFMKPVPQAFRTLLNTIKDEYDNVPVIITENGAPDRSGSLDDIMRIYYLKHYINQVLKAVVIDGCNVKGYTAWSLMDNFEWTGGYDYKFGVYHVDFENPDRPRTLKASGAFLKEIIANHGFVENSSCLY